MSTDLREYDGIPLREPEYKFMVELEKNLGRKINSAKEFNFISGFYAEDGHIYLLGIDHEKLKVLPESIGDLINLEYLNLSYLRLKSIPQSIGKLGNLIELNLDHNKIDSLPETIGNLRNLESLDLSYNNLSTLTNSFGNLTKLQKLILTENKVNIEQNFSNLKKIYDLGCDIHRKSAFKWSNAKIKSYLVNSGKSQEELFDDLFKMKDLLSFRERCSQMHMVEEDIETFWKPKGPEISEWEKKEIFADGRVERKEQEFDDYSWAMYYQDIPLVIDDYEVLKLLESILNMPVPVIERAKINFGFVAFEGRVIELGLHYTGITELPEAIVLLKELEYLDVGKNNLTYIPGWVSYLENLKSFNLEENQLNSLPIEMGEMESLEYLDVSNNKLISIPNSLGDLFGLRYLNLMHNQLNFDEIGDMIENHRRNGCKIETTDAFRLLEN